MLSNSPLLIGRLPAPPTAWWDCFWWMHITRHVGLFWQDYTQHFIHQSELGAGASSSWDFFFLISPQPRTCWFPIARATSAVSDSPQHLGIINLSDTMVLRYPQATEAILRRPTTRAIPHCLCFWRSAAPRNPEQLENYKLTQKLTDYATAAVNKVISSC